MIKRILGCLRKIAGFNIMDVTAAIAITATLAAVLIPSVRDSMHNSRANALMNECITTKQALINFYLQTQRMPILFREGDLLSDIWDINGHRDAKGNPFTTGLVVNGENIPGWNGAQTNDLRKNPFRGDYFLWYDNFPLIDVRNISTSGRESVVLYVTNIPLQVMEEIDRHIDDGDPDLGLIRIVENAINREVGPGSKKLVVVVLPGVKIDPRTGREIINPSSI